MFNNQMVYSNTCSFGMEANPPANHRKNWCLGTEGSSHCAGWLHRWSHTLPFGPLHVEALPRSWNPSIGRSWNFRSNWQIHIPNRVSEGDTWVKHGEKREKIQEQHETTTWHGWGNHRTCRCAHLKLLSISLWSSYPRYVAFPRVPWHRLAPNVTTSTICHKPFVMRRVLKTTFCNWE